MADKTAPSDSRRSPSPADRVKSSAEDPDTATTRKEFDNTRISETPNAAVMSTSQPNSTSEPAADGHRLSGTKTTPELEIPETQNDKLKDQLSSPKKKRAHDEVEQNRDPAQDPNGDVSPIGANGSASLSRSDRLEPEKKRHRDISSEIKESPDKAQDSAKSDSTSITDSSADAAKAGAQPATEKTTKTSESAFKSSGLSGFAAAASPFLTAGAKPLTSFASASASPSPFGASASSKSDTPSVFGGGSTGNGSSPFGQLGGASKPFGGSVFGSGFSSGLGGNKLTSFGQPGGSFKSSKPAKAFGAPDSDPESEAEGEGDEAASNEGETEKQDKDDKETDADAKKTKLQRVTIDNGEAGEATIFQVRAKIFHLDKAESGPAWKERGAGNLKLNVPEQCVDTDENGAVIPGSFDASSLEEGDVKTVRLIMRQDSTHKVILNTTVIPAMTFQEKPMNKTVCVLFTAIEGAGQAVSIQLKVPDEDSATRSCLGNVMRTTRTQASSSRTVSSNAAEQSADKLKAKSLVQDRQASSKGEDGQVTGCKDDEQASLGSGHGKTDTAVPGEKSPHSDSGYLSQGSDNRDDHSGGIVPRRLYLVEQQPTSEANEDSQDMSRINAGQKTRGRLSHATAKDIPRPSVDDSQPRDIRSEQVGSLSSSPKRKAADKDMLPQGPKTRAKKRMLETIR
ncbi:hypothetical protein SUNI508_06511 [Seiridium unicorne]|uniref:RanBD1 domain-containing protein n=1 Tax=Seiridium unicorne TaxID=138068 RepID=A0ABR2V048_9PEZI